jgi:hypothetical protein
MAFEFVPVPASERQHLTQFLLESFHAEPSLNSFRPEVLDWKYFSEHPDWPRPRSFAIKQAGQIVAHGGIWPVRLMTPEGAVKAIHLIDWAASRSAVGAGIHLLRKMAALGDVLLTIGGSPDTRNLLPKLGYKISGKLRSYAWVIRPWLQFRTTPAPDWKTAAKFLRNSARALKGLPAAPEGWRAMKVARFEESIEGIFEQPRSSICPRRTAAGLNYLLRCPAATFSGFVVNQGEKARGYFLLAQVGRQARIVDIRLDSEDRELLQAIGVLAMRTAAGDAETCEIVAASSVAIGGELWLQAGFVQREADPIFCYDPRNLVGSTLPLDLSLADGDLCFFSDPRSPYLS